MKINLKVNNVSSLTKVLAVAMQNQFAVGSFTPRATKMIAPILRAAQEKKSAVIVQTSEREQERYGINLAEFSREFYRVIQEENITIPAVLHLDHTKDFNVITEAIEVGFTSVMIDASDQPFKKNIEITKKVVEYAHSRGVTVEAELGKLGTTDFIETDVDEELFTEPKEAKQFVEETGIDALAVSVGTSHGIYLVKNPKIDIERLIEIRALTSVPLVLHGGSGTPSEMIKHAIQIPNGGISKVNIATDLEHMMMKTLNRDNYVTEKEWSELPNETLTSVQNAVQNVVKEKIENFLMSSDSASYFV
ncbi:class II fructose-bisphosphate aldolase [Peribacillus muralis]|uniref:class II fructose-bisphosphate aldolase n=1 Tax=Peribacillus muralis TaxID=264697 RepID=UPI001F4E122C|nr:class II fructose-bisphosphate aldolase [Peribacillus muralis]MCK1993939.1 class II fructose-bisphosphate aldolase [Peribacillus muralis]MCK2014494.1 class II fructose-bisphosphate aldolase [Peribacillus muralis]